MIFRSPPVGDPPFMGEWHFCQPQFVQILLISPLWGVAICPLSSHFLLRGFWLFAINNLFYNFDDDLPPYWEVFLKFDLPPFGVPPIGECFSSDDSFYHLLKFLMI